MDLSPCKSLQSCCEATRSDHNLTGRASEWREPCNPTLNHTCYTRSSFVTGPVVRSTRKKSLTRRRVNRYGGMSFIGIDSLEKQSFMIIWIIGKMIFLLSNCKLIKIRRDDFYWLQKHSSLALIHEADQHFEIGNSSVYNLYTIKASSSLRSSSHLPEELIPSNKPLQLGGETNMCVISRLLSKERVRS